MRCARTIPLWIVVAIAAAYLLPGLVGHDPWKQDEAYVFGGVFDMLQDGDWIVPKVGGMPFVEKPPLYHWTAAISAWVLRGVLPLHDGARLASGLFAALMLAQVALAARLTWGDGHGRIAVLLALSALGLVGNAQLMITDLPLAAGFAIATAGLAASHRSRPWAGVLLGVGVGLGFLAKGVIAPGVLGLAALSLLTFRGWRSRRYARDLALALVISIPFLVLWPLALWRRSPDLFRVWALDNNLGRYLGFSVGHLGAATEPFYWTQTFPWFLFPLWAFAIAALRAPQAREPGFAIGVAVAGCLALVLATSASARTIYALPMVPALAVACAGVARAGVPVLDRVLRWIACGLAGVMAAIVWYGWQSLVRNHAAPDWAITNLYLPGRFDLHFSLARLGLAACGTAAFIVLAVRARQISNGGLATWVGAAALGWGLPAVLWLPWIDYAKSYRSVYESMRGAMPNGDSCLASLQLGESEQAMLEYFAGIRYQGLGSSCRLVLRERRADKAMPSMPANWTLLWHGSRPEDMHDRFELWLRPSSAS